MKSKLPKFVRIKKSVLDALSEGRPVVALESTVIAHGLPYPKNIEVALELERIIVAADVTPATIAVLHGEVCIGLAYEQLELLGNPCARVEKASTRDLAYLIASRQHGATTVAATMYCARLCGISIFATGGIGGVHRGVNDSFDISADLTQLSRTPVNVVCSGAKSILDIGRTKEVLETLQVPVIGYCCTNFPAFYCRKSGFLVDDSFYELEELARYLAIRRSFEFKGGVVIANPIQKNFEIEKNQMETWILEALQVARKESITGKEVTPFVLKKLFQLSNGKILDANIALLKNNAELAAQVARVSSDLSESEIAS